MFPELDTNGTTLTDDDYDYVNGTDYEGTTTGTTTWSSTTVKDDSESTDGSTWHPDMSTEQSLNMTEYDDYVDYNGDENDYDGNTTDYDYDNATTVDDLDGSFLTTGADITSEDTTTTTTTTTESTSEDYSGDDYDYNNGTDYDNDSALTVADTTTTDASTTEVMSSTINMTGDDDYDYINGTDYDYDNATTIADSTTTDTTTTDVMSTTIEITDDADYDYNNGTDYDYDNATTTDDITTTDTTTTEENDTTTETSTFISTTTMESTTETTTVHHTSTGGSPGTDSTTVDAITNGSTWHPDMSTGDTVTDGSTWHPDMSTEQGVTIDMDDMMNTTEPYEGDYDEGDDYDYNGNATTVIDDVDGSSFTTDIPTTTGEPMQSFTIELQVEIPLKVEFSEDLANPESEEFQALENELFDFFAGLLADQIANGFMLQIEVIVRLPAPVGRKRRSAEASVDVNVRLHNHFPSNIEVEGENSAETYAYLAEQTSQDIAASVSANINEEMSNFESDFIDQTSDAVVSEAGATLDHVEGINCMFNNG